MPLCSLERRPFLAFTLASASVLLSPSEASAQPIRSSMQDIRYVVFHRPGPAWQQGKSMFEQPGVREHVAHYRAWSEAGKLELGGPHLDSLGGGMMIPVAGISEEEVRRFASEDPAVKSGTLLAEVRPWLIGMSK